MNLLCIVCPRNGIYDAARGTMPEKYMKNIPPDIGIPVFFLNLGKFIRLRGNLLGR